MTNMSFTLWTQDWDHNDHQHAEPATSYLNMHLGPVCQFLLLCLCALCVGELRAISLWIGFQQRTWHSAPRTPAEPRDRMSMCKVGSRLAWSQLPQLVKAKKMPAWCLEDQYKRSQLKMVDILCILTHDVFTHVQRHVNWLHLLSFLKITVWKYSSRQLHTASLSHGRACNQFSQPVWRSS